MKKEGYNRNLIGGKRPHKGSTKLQFISLSERVLIESQALELYQKRVKQGKYKNNKL